MIYLLRRVILHSCRSFPEGNHIYLVHVNTLSTTSPSPSNPQEITLPSGGHQCHGIGNVLSSSCIHLIQSPTTKYLRGLKGCGKKLIISFINMFNMLALGVISTSCFTFMMYCYCSSIFTYSLIIIWLLLLANASQDNHAEAEQPQ